MGNTKSIGVAYSDQDIDGGTIGAVTPATVVGTTVYATTEIGYTTAAQGAVTQLTDKSTAVTLNKSAGQITMNNASLATVTTVSFTLNNSVIGAKDTLVVCISSGATTGAYLVYVSNLTAGAATISLRNFTAGPLSEAVVINFSIIHAVV
jgi:catabolite regulation protein CreA